MKLGFYPKLAFDGIRKNKRMYLPYILTCVGMVAMYYIIMFLQLSDVLDGMYGALTVRTMLGLGSWVIAIFSCIFLFYTNSFLMRRRKKEFGLYNILGMGKRNIGLILFWESVLSSAAALVGGLAVGVGLSKLAELGLMNLLDGEVNYKLTFSAVSALMTLAVFGGIFFLLLLNSIRQVKFANALALLRSESVGEKPPKGNWFVGLLGLLILGGAYFIAVTIQDPLAALMWFFVAVIMVIVGTYLLMISGSVVFCRILQRNKRYYYKSNHFVSVASMRYRMKRNGAGLASICILATMVLVMISSTTSLYFGEEETLYNRYPREINLQFSLADRHSGNVGLTDENITLLRESILEVTAKHGAAPWNIVDYKTMYFYGSIEDGVVNTDWELFNTVDMFSDVYQFFFVDIDDYNAMMGTSETLEDDETFIYVYHGSRDLDALTFGDRTYRIKGELDKFVSNSTAAMDIVPSIALIVPDIADAIEHLPNIEDYTGNFKWEFGFDTGLDKNGQIGLYRTLIDEISRIRYENGITGPASDECRELNRQDYLGIFGGLFFLGILLSIVFIFAAVLIIYYKQISEGYEDQARFEIMQKVGMTKREIRKSINSQLLTVFFLPLGLAACHLAFAFPIIRKLLLMFNLRNVMLFALTTLISLLVFAIFYTLVYRITSNAYYHIVSGAKENE